MGVWALDVFGNDAAGDLGFELQDAISLDVVLVILRRYLWTVLESPPEDIYPDDYDAAIAAAALVIAVNAPSVLPASVRFYGPQPWPPVGLVIPQATETLARRLLDRALDPTDNHWLLVAEESNIWTEQTDKVKNLRAHLD